MQTEFQFSEARTTPLQLGRQGEQRAIDAAPDKWKEAALVALHTVCKQNSVFIVDAVWQQLDPKIPCSDRRAMAGVLSEGERRGWCRRTKELQRSSQRQCHGNLRSLWESLISET